MVLARRIGSQRPYALVLLLYVATFGIYGAYWHYKARQEVYRQFELDLEGRDEGVIWLLLDRWFFPLRWIFQYVFVGDVVHVRKRLSLPGGISPGQFLGLTIPGVTLFWMSLFTAAFVGLEDELTATGQVFLAVSAAAMVLSIGFQIPAYYLLQRSLNELWAGYDARIRELIPGGPSPPVAAWPPAPEATASAPAESAWKVLPPQE